MSRLRVTITKLPPPKNYGFDMAFPDGSTISRYFLDTRKLALDVANGEAAKWQYKELRREHFESYAVDGRKVLDGVARWGGGDECGPYVRGLDALECLGERLDEIAAFRAKQRKNATRLRYSPWHPTRSQERRRAGGHVVGKRADADSIAKLRQWFPEKF